MCCAFLSLVNGFSLFVLFGIFYFHFSLWHFVAIFFYKLSKMSLLQNYILDKEGIWAAETFEQHWRGVRLWSVRGCRDRSVQGLSWLGLDGPKHSGKELQAFVGAQLLEDFCMCSRRLLANYMSLSNNLPVQINQESLVTSLVPCGLLLCDRL